MNDEILTESTITGTVTVHIYDSEYQMSHNVRPRTTIRAIGPMVAAEIARRNPWVRVCRDTVETRVVPMDGGKTVTVVDRLWEPILDRRGSTAGHRPNVILAHRIGQGTIADHDFTRDERSIWCTVAFDRPARENVGGWDSLATV